MRDSVHVISEDATFREALERMLDEKTNGLVVTVSHEILKPTGILSSFHLIKSAVPDYLREHKGLAQFASNDQFPDWVLAAENKRVSEIMQPLPHEQWLHEDDTMEKAAVYSAQEDLMYVPVVSRPDHLLTGLISRTDIKRAMAKVIGRPF